MESARPVERSPVLVLVVDDCEVNRLIACAMLANWGITPVVAQGGEEAVRLVREQPFDLVLMDVDMPGLNGLLATEAIRRFERDRAAARPVPVVAYTGSTDGSEAQLRAHGMTDLLKKPCSSRAMAECLQRHCADKFAPPSD